MRAVFTAVCALALRAHAGSDHVYERGACPDEVASDENIECGTLSVPENRKVPSSRGISLPVRIFHSRSATPAPDPLVFLPGGPGNSALTNQRSGKKSPFVEERDLILLEPRGAQLATPALECPELNALKGVMAAGHLRGKAAEAAMTTAASRCRAALVKAGADLDGYTSLETAQDLEDLRLALGLERWNLLGLSYGTRLALTVLRTHPEGVRSVILDSVLPPEANFDETAASNLWRALNVVFDGCATNVACHTAFPRLRQDFAALVRRADQRPLQLSPVILGSDRKPVVVDGAQVVEAIYGALHDPGGIAFIPRVIEEAFAGKPRRLARLIEENQGPSTKAWGLRLSIWCGEEAPFENEALTRGQVSPDLGLGGIDERTTSAGLCRAWKVSPADASENQPVSSEVPVLVFTGEFDPDTPPDWGRGLITHLPNARVILFPGRSHGAGFTACGAQLATAFLRDPKAPLEADCVLGMRGVDFEQSTRPAE